MRADLFDPGDPSIIWVSPSVSSVGGDGTAENPFGTIERALSAIRPGYTVVLKAGTYPGSVNFEISGALHEPVRITADNSGSVEVAGGCWFFYDSSDLIVSGITFRDAPFGAISVIGSCERNRFENLRFINCGLSEKTSCTLFFGGSGGDCNIVENCSFEHTAVKHAARKSPDTMSVGLMVSEGDAENGAPITNHVYRKNLFVNYDYGILVGTNDASRGLYGHIVEYNTVENSGVEGILVKCGDTIVRGNVVRHCVNNSITIAAGKGSVIEDNRIVDCGNGIRVNDADHTVANNCIIRCGGPAVWACGEVLEAGTRRSAATNLFIENNTFVDCGTGAPRPALPDTAGLPVAGVRIDPGTSCILRRNLMAGKNRAVATGDPSASGGYNGSASRHLKTAVPWVITDNIASDDCLLTEGVSRAEVVFIGSDRDDYTNGSGYGAQGWMLKPEAFDPDLDSAAESDTYCRIAAVDDDDDEDDEPVESCEEENAGADFDAGAFMTNLFKPDGDRS